MFDGLSPPPAGLPSRLSLHIPQADHRLALLQHGTKLYLVNMAAISRDVFYQLLLTRWEAVPVMQLAQPLHVGTLMELALRQEEAAGRWQVRRTLASGACAGMQILWLSVGKVQAGADFRALVGVHAHPAQTPQSGVVLGVGY